MANHDILRMDILQGLIFVYRTMKTTGYSHESIEMTSSSIIASSLIEYYLVKCKTIVVSLIFMRPKLSIVYLVITLMTYTKYINVLEREKPFIYTLTAGLPGFEYLVARVFPIIKYARSPTTWTVGGYFYLFLGFVRHNSLITLEYL